MMEMNPEDEDLPFLRCLFMVERRVKIVESLLPPESSDSDNGKMDVEKATVGITGPEI